MSKLTMPPRRPGGQMASRPLHFIWLVDASGSMRLDGKMAALNQAIRDSIPHMQAVARDHPYAAISVNAIKFSDEAQWLGERLTSVSEFQWTDIEAGGVTAMGEALTMVADALQPPLMTDRGLPSVLALVTDGLPTDDFKAGMEHLLSTEAGRQALRVVVAIGADAASKDAQEIFRAFIDNNEIQTFQANNPEALAVHIRWVSTAVLQAVLSPSAQLAGAVSGAVEGGPLVPMESGDPDGELNGESDVW